MDTPDRLSTIMTHLDLGIRGEALRKDDITALLGIEPTRAFEKGEVYLGRERTADGAFRNVERVRPWGVWHFRTQEFITTDSVNEHALFLLGRFASVRDKIRGLLSDSGYHIMLTIWYVGPSGFSVSAEVMSQLAALCGEISITCWEPRESSIQT